MTRRKLMQAVGLSALMPPLSPAADLPAPRLEGKDTPKICLEMGTGGLAAGAIDEAGMRRVKQLGVDHVSAEDRAFPGKKNQLRG